MADGKLGITGATQGFDISGIDAYIRDINVNLVDKAIEELRKNSGEVKETVNSVWVGDSAETFKKNLDYDVNTIIGALTDAREVLVGAIYHAAQNLRIIDENLVQKRGE